MGILPQLLVFAAIFLIFQMGFDMIQGVPITSEAFLTHLLSTIIAAVIYGALVLWLNKRKERGE